MDNRIIYRILIYYALIIFIAFFTGCSSPMDIDAQRGDKIIVGNQSYDISFNPDTLDFGLLHPNETSFLSFEVINQKTVNYTINELSIFNHQNLFKVINYQLFTLGPKNTQNDRAEFMIKAFAQESYGVFIDSLYVNDLKNPDLKLLMTVPAVFASDVDFGNVSINEGVGSKFITFRNISNENIIIHNIKISNENFELKPSTDDFTIEANTKTEMIITFNPTEQKSYNGILTFEIKNNDDLPYDGEVYLTGNGVN